MKREKSVFVCVALLVVVMLLGACHSNLDDVKGSYFVITSAVEDSIRIFCEGDSTWQFVRKNNIEKVKASERGCIEKTLYLKANESVAVVGVDSILSIEGFNENVESYIDVDLSHLTQTVSLTIHHKGLKSLNLSSLKALRSLDCEYCNLSDIDLQNNPNLVYLKCSENRLKSLDLSKMYFLRQLMCSDNQLEYLNVANGINYLFYDPYCYIKTSNYLKSLDYPDINSVVVFPDVMPCFDSRNNPNLRTIMVDYGFKHNTDEWLKDDHTEWKLSIEDNLQKEKDPFFVRHRNFAKSSFSKKERDFMSVLASKNPQKIAKLFHYPIRLKYPVEDIIDEEMFVSEFDEIFANNELEHLLLVEPESFYNDGIHTNYFSSGVTYKYFENKFRNNVAKSYFEAPESVFKSGMVPIAHYKGTNYSLTVDKYTDNETGMVKLLMYIQDNEKSMVDEPLFYCDDVYYDHEADEENNGKNAHIMFIGKDESNDYLMVGAAFFDTDSTKHDYLVVKKRFQKEKEISTCSELPMAFFEDIYTHFEEDVLVDIVDNQASVFEF